MKKNDELADRYRRINCTYQGKRKNFPTVRDTRSTYEYCAPLVYIEPMVELEARYSDWALIVRSNTPYTIPRLPLVLHGS